MTRLFLYRFCYPCRRKWAEDNFRAAVAMAEAKRRLETHAPLPKAD